MNKEQSVYNKLHKFSKTQEPIKVELGMVQEAVDAANQLLEIAEELGGTKRSLKADMRRIDGYVQDGKQYQKYAEALKRDIRSANKNLGISDSETPVLKFLDDALGAWQSSLDMKI
jgi:hypothetical protein